LKGSTPTATCSVGSRGRRQSGLEGLLAGNKRSFPGSNEGILETMPAAKEPVPIWRWAIWWLCLGAGIVLFYVLLTPIWLGLRGLARLADLRRRAEGS
jgi:hypothetical protein